MLAENILWPAEIYILLVILVAINHHSSTLPPHCVPLTLLSGSIVFKFKL